MASFRGPAGRRRFAALAALVLLVRCGASVAPVRTPPARPADWRDGIVYFVLLDRFADGDPGNDVAVDRSAKGAFHGGDVRGLREHLDEIAGLGVTAIWI
ncbi:MAG TPA: alpha-amylase, partial [Thermoanaerobaculia bacterium]|nr:alpha-amylase [Thermoanaerobaculia bacterium]